jgi:dTDP-4-dehydrorhamnose 3,5-epimerase
VKSEALAIPGAVKITLEPFRDDRGAFFETFRKDRYAAAGIPYDFVQDNRSISRSGVLRGLHYQITRPQGHLVTLTSGRILDVGLDLRPGSPAFGTWVAAELTADPPVQLFLPPGVAHGFCVLSDSAEIWYKCTDYYQRGDEGGVLWNDPDLGIPLPVERPLIAARDAALPRLKDVAKDRLPRISFRDHAVHVTPVPD